MGACTPAPAAGLAFICDLPYFFASSKAFLRSSAIFFLSSSSSSAVFYDYSVKARSLCASSASFAPRALSASAFYIFCSSIKAFSSRSFYSSAALCLIISDSAAEVCRD